MSQAAMDTHMAGTEPHLPKRSAESIAIIADDSDDVFPVEVKNVWSRSGSRYRIRAVVLLGVNVLLFAGLGSFAYWLRTGVRFAPIMPGYVDDLMRTFRAVGIMGRSDMSLGSLLMTPINVQEVPMQIPILGLLMAALISIPILVAILYRFWSSLPFVAVVGFLAVMPWLAITLLGSCLLASAKPFRTRFRFMSALLGLVPAVIYLVLAWWGTTDWIIGKIDPIDRIKFVSPWVLAIVASTVVFALVLSIARLVDYRPGAIAPLLAIMFGLPVALFEFGVGRDELYYRLLEAMNSAHFADVDASLALDDAVREALRRQPVPLRDVDAVREMVATRWQFSLTSDLEADQSALALHQAELIDRCDWFLRYFPHSPYAVNAMFIKGRAMDMRVDPRAFRETKWIRFYDDFPSGAPRARRVWEIVADNAPGPALWGAAELRLAQLDARAGYVDRAVDRLRELEARLAVTQLSGVEATAEAGSLTSVLARGAPDSSLAIRPDTVLFEARRLRDLIVSNRDPVYSYDPLCGPRGARPEFSFGLLDADPRSEHYVENLRRLAREYPNCQLRDNIELEIAKVAESPDTRVERLRAVIERFPTRDAIPEALFRLGVQLMEQNDLADSARTFRRLFADHADHFWTRQAARYARWTPFLHVGEENG